jgi:hypothetical protein
MTIEIDTQIATVEKDLSTARQRKTEALAALDFDGSDEAGADIDRLERRLADLRAAIPAQRQIAEAKRQREAVKVRAGKVAKFPTKALAKDGAAVHAGIDALGEAAKTLRANLIAARNDLVGAVMDAAPDRLLAGSGISPLPELDIFILRRLVGAGAISAAYLNISITSRDAAIDIGQTVEKIATNLAAQAARAPLHILEAAE